MDKHLFEQPETRTDLRQGPWGGRTPAAPDRPPGDEPVLFYAVRDRRIAWSAVALMAILLSPLAFFAPDVFVAAILAHVVMVLIEDRVFRFELSARTLHLRPGLFARPSRIPLADVAEAEVLTLQGVPAGVARPPLGHLRLRLLTGGEILVMGLVDPAEAAEAVRVLRDRLSPAS